MKIRYWFIFILLICFSSCDEEKYTASEYNNYGQQKYDEGKETGYSTGKQDGMKVGYEKGKTECHETGQKEAYAKGYEDGQNGIYDDSNLDYGFQRQKWFQVFGVISMLIMGLLNMTAIFYILNLSKYSLRMAIYLGIALGILCGCLINIFDLTFLVNMQIEAGYIKVLLGLIVIAGTFLFFYILTLISHEDGAWLNVITVFILTVIVLFISVLFLNYNLLISNNNFMLGLFPLMAIGGILFCIHFFITINRAANA